MASLPEGCEVLKKLEADKHDVPKIIAIVDTEPTIEQAKEQFAAVGFDSLDAVELSMDAEECAHCSATAEECALGSLLIRMVEEAK